MLKIHVASFDLCGNTLLLTFIIYAISFYNLVGTAATFYHNICKEILCNSYRICSPFLQVMTFFRT